ncbi:MAG: hypothetical protein NTX50_31085 [Candidatus Sumerlaeota bacterium]|nr:hypothetical protein [Candidatus Sumerlaeota bacterium]
MAAAQSQKKEVRRSRKQEKRAAGGNAESLPRQQDPRAAGGNAEALSRQSEDEAWLQALLSASEANDDDLALYAESVLDDEDAMSDEDTMDDDGLEDDEYMPAADKRLLRNSLLEAVENQLNAGDPPETRETLQRLMTEGLSEKDAKLHIANVIVTEMWHISRSHEVFNHDRFVRNLRRLPGELEESEEPED